MNSIPQIIRDTLTWYKIISDYDDKVVLKDSYKSFNKKLHLIAGKVYFSYDFHR